MGDQSDIFSLNEAEPLFDEFVGSLGMTGRYWVMSIEMVNIARKYIRAERASDWDDHILQTEAMLPYIVAAGHTKCMVCLPLYLQDMRSLPQTHPYMYEQFKSGNFTVHRKGGSVNGIWTDMALEQTFNREGKATLLTGITQAASVRDKLL